MKFKGTLLYTDEGIMLIGAIPCSNGRSFNAEGCFGYCEAFQEYERKHQAMKLKSASTLLNGNIKKDEYWYRNKDNFKDIEFDA